MASKLEICNMALQRLGEGEITSLDEGSTQSRMCELHFDQALESTLNTYPWGCAVSRKHLARNIDSPEFGFQYSYALPADFIRLIQAYDQSGLYNQKYRWVVEGGNLLTNIEDAYIKYVRLIPDVGVMSPLATDALICKLAMALTMGRTESKSIYASLFEEYEKVILPRAKAIDAIENRDISEMETGFWVGNRSGTPFTISN